MTRYPKIAILTGAGISAESGLGTFRDKDGLWTKYDISEVATPEGFARNPKLVLDFYNARRANLESARPNAGHHALAQLEHAYKERQLGTVTLITQNVDDLHEQAGSVNIIHIHGELRYNKCNNCAVRTPADKDLTPDTVCTRCESKGTTRPDVVWFGEMPYHLDRIETVVADCDLFISIGTSGAVYPAAGLVNIARQAGAHTAEINLEPSEGAHYFHDHQYGPASEAVPAYVRSLIGDTP